MGLGKTYSTDYLVDSNGNTGVAGQILVTTATGVSWQDAENNGDNQTQGSLFDSKIVLIDTPNGGLKTYRVITDEYGEWIQVGRFAANAMTTIQGNWSSVSGLSTGIAQSETTQFSADFGDSFPTEVRVVGATDFNNWRNTRTIDWIYKSPEGRKWKYFFSGGAENGMTQVPLVGGVGNRWGWTVNGAYDGFGRWTNATLANIGMSDSNPTNPSAAYSTATSNAFNWDAASDAKLTVNAYTTYSGQDQGTTSGVGSDDATNYFFDSYPTQTSNGVPGGSEFSSAVWVLIKLPGGASGSGGGGGYWAANGNDIYNTNADYVGIGTSSPGDKLNVEGNILLGTTDKIGWRYYSGNASYNFITGEDQILTLSGGTWTSSGTQTAVRIKTIQGEKVTIRNNGDVGIGTTSPDAKFEVAGGTSGIRLSNVGDSGAYDSIEMTYNGYNSGTPEMKFRPTQTPGTGIVSSYFRFINSNGSSTTANNYANVSIDGSLGIGTQAPNSKLEVSGGLTQSSNPNSIATSIRMGTNTTTGLQFANRFFSSISGTIASGVWIPIVTVADSGTFRCTLVTAAHSNVTFIASRGYNGSNRSHIQVLDWTYNPNGTYANVSGLRIRVNGQVEMQMTYTSGPSVSVNVVVNGAGAAIVASLAETTDVGGSVLDTVLYQNDGMMRSSGTMQINNTPALGSAATRFLVPDTFTGATNMVKSRTAAQVLSDIGGAPATGGSYLPLAGGTLTGDLYIDKVGPGILLKDGAQDVAWLGDFGGGTDGQLVLFDNAGVAKVALNGQANSYFNGGNVGIGITGPSYKLDVSGTARITGDVGLGGATQTNRKLKVTGHSQVDGNIYVTGAATNYSVEVGQSRTTAGTAFLDLTGEVAPDDYGLRMIRYGGANALSKIVHTGTNNLEINAENGGDIVFTGGNVGIGTTSPERVLHLDADQGRAIIQLDKGGDKIFNVGTGSSATGADDTILQLINEGVEKVRIFTEGDSFFNGGNVGIGTTGPQALLEVDSQTYSAANAIANFVNGNNPVRVAYDTVVIAQQDVPCLSIVETIDGSQANEQKLTFSVGDNSAVIGSSVTAANGLYINTNRPTNSQGYSTTAGTNVARFLNNGYSIFMGNVGIGVTGPIEKLQVEGKVYVQGSGQNWNETTPGTTRGSVHFDPGTSVDNTGNALTFGASDAFSGSNAQAGIYTRSDGSYGTKMYFATTNSYVSGSKTAMMIDSNANVGIGDTNPSYKLDVNGTIRATGDIIAYSDARVKENIKTIDNALNKIDKLRGVEFNKIGEDIKSIGVIAQEIEKVIPEVVREDDKGMKSVAYGNISGLLIEAIKELKAEIDLLKSKPCTCNKCNCNI